MKRRVCLLVTVILACFFLIGCGNIDKQKEDIEFFSTDEDVFEIETPYCNLYYPLLWKDQIVIDFDENDTYAVKFSAKVDSETIPLFDLYFGGTLGDKIGELTVNQELIDIRMESHGFNLDVYSEDQKNDICAMNEDVNVIISKLLELYDFELVQK